MSAGKFKHDEGFAYVLHWINGGASLLHVAKSKESHLKKIDN